MRRRREVRRPRVRVRVDHGEAARAERGLPGGGAPARAGAGDARTRPRRRRVPDAPLLPSDLAERLLERALRRGGDFADLYVERRSTFSLALDDRRLERAQSGQETGAALRVVAGESTYFAHVDGLAEGDLERLADEVSAAVRAGHHGAAPAAGAHGSAHSRPSGRRPRSVPAARKAELLRECDERARAAGDAVTQVAAAYNEARRRGPGRELRRRARGRRSHPRAARGAGCRAPRTIAWSRAWSRLRATPGSSSSTATRRRSRTRRPAAR